MKSCSTSFQTASHEFGYERWINEDDEMRQISLACCCVLVLASVVTAAELRINSAAAATTVFAESEAKWNFRIRTNENWSGSVKWRVRHAERNLISGEREVVAKPDQPGMLVASFKWPTVKDGAALKVEVVVSAEEAEYSQFVWIMPRDPFSERRKWVKGLKLKLLDPDDSVAEKWEALEVPFSRVKSIGAVDALDDGVFVVSGGSEEKVADWMPQLMAATKRGVPVIWWGTPRGRFEWPGDDDSLTAIQMRRSDVIRELDERLDATSWMAKAVGLKWTTRRDAIVAEITDDRTAWPWCEWDFAIAGQNSHQRAKLVWMGWRVAETWDESPVPRYLLRALLERVGSNREQGM